MSETRRYRGYLVELPLPEGVNVLDYAAGLCKEKGYDWARFCETALEYLEDAGTHLYNRKTEKLYALHCSEEDVNESYIRTMVAGNVIHFETQFYNGGTCLQEMLEEELSNLEDL